MHGSCRQIRSENIDGELIYNADQTFLDKVRENAELKRLLAEIGAPLKRMNDDLKNIRDGLEATKRAEIMRWLSSEPYIQHHAQAKVGVLPGTGQWLLSDPLFKRWKNESASSILWLHGIPGSGKSKLV